MSAIAGWENFNVIVGSSAGVLIGLSIVHFGTVLLLSAIACVPWPTLLGVAIFYGVLSLLGCFSSSSLFAACAH